STVSTTPWWPTCATAAGLTTAHRWCTGSASAPTARRGHSTLTPCSRRRRRRPSVVHHVHLRHHWAAEGRAAHPRQRAVECAHGVGQRRRAVPGPLPDLHAAVSRRGAQP